MTDEHADKRGEVMPLHELPTRFLQVAAPQTWFRDLTYDGPCELIDLDKVEELTDLLQGFIADVVATILDAGSERDAVNENAELRGAIRNELIGWTREGTT